VQTKLQQIITISVRFFLHNVSGVDCGSPSATFRFRPDTPGRPNFARQSATVCVLQRGWRHCLNFRLKAIFTETCFGYKITTDHLMEEDLSTYMNMNH